MSSLFPAGANHTSTGEFILWGYVCNPMSLSRRGRGTQAVVATLKRPPPCKADQCRPLAASDPSQIRISKSEIVLALLGLPTLRVGPRFRNKFERQIPKRSRQQPGGVHGFGHLNFDHLTLFRISCLGFRIFHFLYKSQRSPHLGF